MLRGAAANFIAVTLAIGLAGCIESKRPLLPDSEAITSAVPGIYVTSSNDVGADGVRELAHWIVSREGAQYRIQGPPTPGTGKMPTAVGTLHPFDNHYVLFQYHGDGPFHYHDIGPVNDEGYSYWLLSLHSNWILIDTIDCDSKVLKQARGGSRCNDIKSRNVLFALAKISAQHSLDLQNKAAANSDHAGVALRIQDR
jgi:hypothetical protein